MCHNIAVSLRYISPLFTELTVRKVLSVWPMRLCLHEQLRNVSNSESHQICIWLRCCGYRLLPFPMNLSLSAYITEVIFL